MTTDEFIRRAKDVHGNKYDYSITEYNGPKVKVKYVCPKHGIIEQNPSSHLSGSGCRFCGIERSHKNAKDTTETFIKKAEKVHGNKFDYSLVEYFNSQTKVKVICHEKDALGNEHGVFIIKPNSHINGKGCPKCNGKNKTTEEWVAEAKKVYPDKRYTFSKTKYTHARNKVIVTCAEHGDFLTLARDFLRGHGCPKCQRSRLENDVENALEKNHIEYISQKKFDWLKPLSLDFYLPKFNVAIECQGKQHYLETTIFNEKEPLKIRQERDERKRQLCNGNGVKLIYFIDNVNKKYENSGVEYFTATSDLIKYLTTIIK